jgi:hypothetical protein
MDDGKQEFLQAVIDGNQGLTRSRLQLSKDCTALVQANATVIGMLYAILNTPEGYYKRDDLTWIDLDTVREMITILQDPVLEMAQRKDDPSV